MAKKHKLNLSIQDLKERGWTEKGIEEAFKEPDKYSPRTKEALFLRKRVERVEKVHGAS